MGPDEPNVSLRDRLVHLGVSNKRLLQSNGLLELARYILSSNFGAFSHPFSPGASSLKSLSCVERWRVANSRGFFTSRRWPLAPSVAVPVPEEYSTS